MNITMRGGAGLQRVTRAVRPAFIAALPSILASLVAATPGAAVAAGNSGAQPVTGALGGQAGIDGWLTLGAVTVGALLAVLYLRGMYLVLHYAAETYDVSLEQVDDADYSSSGERKLLSIGSVALVVVSALIIAAYGWGWQLLYMGPVLSLLGPIVIIASMESDIRKYRRVLQKQTLPRAVPPNAARI